MTMMVERAARTLCACLGHDPDAPTTERNAVSYDQLGAPTWIAYGETARRVITAMRNPAPEMLDSEVTESDGQNWRLKLAEHDGCRSRLRLAQADPAMR